MDDHSSSGQLVDAVDTYQLPLSFNATVLVDTNSYVLEDQR